MLMKSGFCFFLLAVLQVSARYKNVMSEFTEDVIELEAEALSSSSGIVWGWEAQPGQLPHHASIRTVSSAGTMGYCGGSIVSRRWVLTAAQCTAGRVNLIIRAGVVSLSDNNPENIFETTEWYNFPTFDDSRPTPVQPNDITLVRLPRQVVYSGLLQRIRVQPGADAYRDYDGDQVYVSGHGSASTSASVTDELRWVNLQAISNNDCARSFASGTVLNTIICAELLNGTSQSACQGDFGGPLVHISSDGVPTLVGLFVFTPSEDNACPPGLPTGYTRPGPYLPWFQQITGINFENLQDEEDEVEETTTTSTSTTTLPTTTASTTTPSTTTTSTTTPSTTTTSTTTPSTTTTPVTTTTSTTTPSTTTTPVTTPTSTTTPSTTTTSTTTPSTTTTSSTPPTTTTSTTTLSTTTTSTITPSTTTTSTTTPSTTTPSTTTISTTTPSTTTPSTTTTSTTTPSTTATPSTTTTSTTTPSTTTTSTTTPSTTSTTTPSTTTTSTTTPSTTTTSSTTPSTTTTSTTTPSTTTTPVTTPSTTTTSTTTPSTTTTSTTTPSTTSTTTPSTTSTTTPSTTTTSTTTTTIASTSTTTEYTPDESTTSSPEDSEEQEPDDTTTEVNTTAPPVDKEDEEEDSSDCNKEDDMAQLMKRFEVKVKVKVGFNKYMSNAVEMEDSHYKH